MKRKFSNIAAPSRKIGFEASNLPAVRGDTSPKVKLFFAIIDLGIILH